MNETLQFDRCPACGYSLEGLPTVHRCPECGLAYDVRWVVFGDVRAIGLISTLTRFPLAAWGLFVLTGLGLTMSFLRTRDASVLLILLIFVAVFVWLRTRERHCWIALTPSGVRRYRRGRIEQEIRWDEFDAAEIVQNRLVLRSRGTTNRIADSRTFWFSEPEMRRCRDWINRARLERRA